MYSKHIEKALQLLSVDSKGRIILHNQALVFLNSLQSPISIVCIAGPYRTGKSYLLNSLLGLLTEKYDSYSLTKDKQQVCEEKSMLEKSEKMGFKVGKTIRSCTKGIWIYNTPILTVDENDQVTNMVLMDSQGFGDVNDTQNSGYDYRILAIGLMVANVLLYNSKNAIDTGSLADIREIMQIVDAIKGNKNTIFNENQKGDFHWILRDFHLRLINQSGVQLSPNSYLEASLQNSPAAFIQTVKMLRSNFRYLHCHTFVQPFTEQYDKIEQRPQFTAQVLQLKKKLKPIKSSKFNGENLVSRLSAYVEAVNNEQVLNYKEGLLQAYVKSNESDLKGRILQRLEYLLEENQIDLQIGSGKQNKYQSVVNQIKGSLRQLYEDARTSENFKKQRQKQINSRISQYLQELNHPILRTNKIYSLKSEASALDLLNKFKINQHEFSYFDFPEIQQSSINHLSDHDLQIQMHRLKLELEELKNENTLLQETKKKVVSDNVKLKNVLEERDEMIEKMQRNMDIEKREWEQRELDLDNRIRQNELMYLKNMQIAESKNECIGHQIKELRHDFKNHKMKLREDHEKQLERIYEEYHNEKQELLEQIQKLKQKISDFQNTKSQSSLNSSRNSLHQQPTPHPHHTSEENHHQLKTIQQLLNQLTNTQNDLYTTKKQNEEENQLQLKKHHAQLEHLAQIHQQSLSLKDQLIVSLEEKIEQQSKEINRITQNLIQENQNYQMRVSEMKSEHESEIRDIQTLYKQLLADYEYLLAANTQKTQQIQGLQQRMNEQKVKISEQLQTKLEQNLQENKKMRCVAQQLREKVKLLQQSNKKLSEQKERQILKLKKNIENLEEKYEENSRQKKLWEIVKDGYEHKLMVMSKICDRYRTMLGQHNIQLHQSKFSNQFCQNEPKQGWKEGCYWGINYQKQIEDFKENLNVRFGKSFKKQYSIITEPCKQRENRGQSFSKIRGLSYQPSEQSFRSGKNLGQFKLSEFDEGSGSKEHLRLITEKSIQYSEYKLESNQNLNEFEHKVVSTHKKCAQITKKQVFSIKNTPKDCQSTKSGLMNNQNITCSHFTQEPKSTCQKEYQIQYKNSSIPAQTISVSTNQQIKSKAYQNEKNKLDLSKQKQKISTITNIHQYRISEEDNDGSASYSNRIYYKIQNSPEKIIQNIQSAENSENSPNYNHYFISNRSSQSGTAQGKCNNYSIVLHQNPITKNPVDPSNQHFQNQQDEVSAYLKEYYRSEQRQQSIYKKQQRSQLYSQQKIGNRGKEWVVRCEQFYEGLLNQERNKQEIMREKLQEVSNYCKQLEEKVQKENMKVGQLREQNEKYEKIINQNAELMKQYKAGIQGCIREVSQQTRSYIDKKHEQISRKLTEKEKQVYTLTQQIKTINREKQRSLKAIKFDFDEEKEKLITQLKMRETQMTNLKKNLQKSQKQLLTLQKQYSLLQQNLGHQEATSKITLSANLEKHRKQIEHISEKYEIEIETSKKRAQQLLEKNQALQARQKEQKEQIKELFKTIESAKKQNYSLLKKSEQEKLAYERALKLMRTKIFDLQKNVDSPEDRQIKENEYQRMKALLQLTRTNYMNDFQIWRQKQTNYHQAITKLTQDKK